MILFQDNKEEEGESSSGTLESFEDIKSIGASSAEKARGFFGIGCLEVKIHICRMPMRIIWLRFLNVPATSSSLILK